jgi:hypothetical protein
MSLAGAVPAMGIVCSGEGQGIVLFVGDDWAEDHHDVEIQDHAGRVLARARFPEGVAGVAKFHALIAAHLPVLQGQDQAGQDVSVELAGEVWLGIETDRGPWVAALVAAGYRVFPVNPRQVARFRERHSNAGGKSDVQDAHALADLVRTDGHQLRAMAGDSPASRAVQVPARAHQSLVWERVRYRLRAGLRQYYPAALEAFEDLAAADVLELLAKAPDPAGGARLTKAQVGAALRRARRRDVDAKAAAVMSALRSPALALPTFSTHRSRSPRRVERRRSRGLHVPPHENRAGLAFNSPWDVSQGAVLGSRSGHRQERPVPRRDHQRENKAMTRRRTPPVWLPVLLLRDALGRFARLRRPLVPARPRPRFRKPTLPVFIQLELDLA